MDDLPIVQERLRLARQRAGLSQDALADRTGLYPSELSQMEMGRRLPTVPQLRQLALALGVSTDYLVGLQELPAETPTPAPAPAPSKRARKHAPRPPGTVS